MRAEVWVGCAQDKDHRRMPEDHQEPGESLVQTLPQSLGGGSPVDPWTSDFWSPGG